MKGILHLKTSLYTVIITVALSSLAIAERTAQILYFKAPQTAPKEAVIYQGKSEPVEVLLPKNNFSISYKLASGDIVLKFLPSLLNEDEKFPVNAPSLNIPASWEKVLILAFSDPKNPVMPVRFKAVNASQGTLGKGDRMFINFTDNNVFGLVGKKKLSLKANSTAIVKIIARPKEEYRVQLDRIDPVLKKRLPLIRQMWRHSARRRSLILIYSPAGSTSVTYYNAPIRDL